MNSEHVTHLCADYALGKPIQIDTDREGVLNMNYILTTDKDTFFIKSIRDKKKKHIAYVAEVEEFMQSHEVPAICMLSTQLGKKFVSYENDVYTVYPFINS